MTKILNIAVGADGAGTTFEEIARATINGKLKAKVVLLFTNKDSCLAAEKARRFGIPVLAMNKKQTKVAYAKGPGGLKEERDKALYDALKNNKTKIDLICLAGYLRLIPPCVISAFPKRIINSHPSLDLKRFGGKGMYGKNVTKAVIEIEAELKETGSTIHFVSKIYDDPGGIICQTKPIKILPKDTPESLLKRQLPAERKLYIEVINSFCEEILL